jgi:hypothetical protein
LSATTIRATKMMTLKAPKPTTTRISFQLGVLTANMGIFQWPHITLTIGEGISNLGCCIRLRSTYDLPVPHDDLLRIHLALLGQIIGDDVADGAVDAMNHIRLAHAGKSAPTLGPI